MSDDKNIEIGLLHLKDARHLAPLLAHYVQSLKRGAPRRPDEYYAETLLQDRAAQIFGARLDGSLVGFVIFYDLPDPVSGMRLAQVDHIYVSHEHRGMGIARAMIDMLADQADIHGWQRMVLNAPRLPEDGRKLYEKIAAAADHTSWQIVFDHAPSARDRT